MIYPLQLSTVARKESDIVKAYGAKAASLAKLKEAGKPVPKAWLLPCEASIARPSINLVRSSIPEEALYSVRSGAPVSMPGLLKTELNVHYGGLYKAICAVWNSWNSEDAVAYRGLKDISGDIGTGVIIQQMVPKQVYAMTAFTAQQTPSFDPVVEGYKGLGEALVSGEVTGDKIHEHSFPWSKRLFKQLAEIHTLWGPSDLELAVDADAQVWWLQWRKLVIPDYKEISAPNGGTVIGVGMPIGAPTSVCVPIHKATVDKPHAVYVSNFGPANYDKIFKADAVICAYGGTTCHAAIIARNMGKPAISGLHLNSITFGKPVWIDGRTGHIYSATKSDSITVSTKKEELPEPSLPSYKLISSSYSFRDRALLVRFYWAEEHLRTGVITKKRYDEIVDELLLVLLTYAWCACLGEFRHVLTRNGWSTIEPLLKKYDLDATTLVFNSSSTRGEIIAMNLPKVKTLKRATNIMLAVTEAFETFLWGSGYGGKKWAVLSKHVLRYLQKEISASIFIDQLFNMVHNGGSIFGKIALVESGAYLQMALSQKRIGWKELVRVAKDYEITFAEKESILNATVEK